MCMVSLLVCPVDLGIRLDESNCSISIDSCSVSSLFFPTGLKNISALDEVSSRESQKYWEEIVFHQSLYSSVTDPEGQKSMKLNMCSLFPISFIFCFKRSIVEISTPSSVLARIKLTKTPCMSQNCRVKQCGLYGS